MTDIAIGATVHYVHRESTSRDADPCWTALITAVHPSEGEGSLANLRGPEPVDLAVPAFRKFRDRVRHSEGARTEGTWHWPDEGCRTNP